MFTAVGPSAHHDINFVYVIIYEKVTNACSKNRQYLKNVYQNQWYVG